MRQRNIPLKRFVKKSPMKVDKKSIVSTAVELAKPLAKGVTKAGLGAVGAMLDATTTSKTDQPQYHGGPKPLGNLSDMK
jgi:hypothetical protein